MMKEYWKIGLLSLLVFSVIVIACSEPEEPEPMPIVDPEPDPDPDPDPDPEPDVYTSLLSNQVNEVIIPTYIDYQAEMNNFLVAVESFVDDADESGLTTVKEAYQNANLVYQAAAVHNYYATINVDLVNTTNLYPVDVDLLEEFIETEAYNFNVTAQRRANGFPALDYLLYGSSDVLATFVNQPKRGAFLLELVKSLGDKADSLVDRWTGSLRENFIGNGGTELGSSISVQLNNTVIYYEEHIRENKVGIPIGRLGPNDSPIPADDTKIESYYRSVYDDSDGFTLELLRAAVEEMEDTYLGVTSSGEDGQGYDDLLLAIDQGSIDTDIKAIYADIYSKIDERGSISGDETLYESIQALITIYKSDLFPVLNVQDADGSNDGD